MTALMAAAMAAGCGSSSTSGQKDGGTTGSAGNGTTGTAGRTGTTGTAGTGSGTPGTAGTGSGNPGTAGGTYDGSLVGTEGGITKIPIGMTACSDGKDNDMDGLIDSADPECTGPADNDESTFATGIPGDNIDACKQDCFFDGNSGMGDDGCDWQLKCDPLSKNSRCPYDMNYAKTHTMECSVATSQSQKCIDNCRKYVPNGCDCFGCCVVPGAPTPIHLDPTCTAASFADPTKCSPCTQVTQCQNTCGRCEICVGKPTVPADCGYPDGGVPPPDGSTPPPYDGGVPVCEEGYQTCVPGPEADCPVGFGCVTGCCLPIVQ
jgi:hypothetical protein